jgi:hypothetical protein
LFSAVGQALESNRQALNQADPYNGNHGDHVVQIFQLASQAAEEKRDLPPAEIMEHAALLLQGQKQNGSAQEYARGLACMAEQFRKYEITLDGLVSYVRGVLVEDREALRTDTRRSSEGSKQSDPASEKRSGQEVPSAKSGKVLKALVSGLAAWGQDNEGKLQSGNPLDMGALFELGMVYLQARQRGGSKIEILADAAASASPLGKVPHRCLSGKVAIQAFLQAMRVD